MITSTTEPSTTTTTGSSAVDRAVWPASDSSARFDDPTEAATSFATEYLTMNDPDIGEFQQGDTRSGEIEIKAGPAGAVTTLLLRQLDASDSWWILAAVSAEVTVDQPDALTVVVSPLIVSGAADIAGGGQLDLELRGDGKSNPLDASTVAVPPGDSSLFRVELTWDEPEADWGALAVVVRDDDGAVTGAHVSRVRFENS